MTIKELETELDGTYYAPSIVRSTPASFIDDRMHGLSPEELEKLRAYDSDKVLYFGGLWQPGGQDFSGWVWAQTADALAEILRGEAKRLRLI